MGRQQHVIISQGHLDAILEARPEDRRAVIEEAAGVLKYRRRRERSERRLASTEENLERLFDLVREVKRQIRPLDARPLPPVPMPGWRTSSGRSGSTWPASELEALDRRHADGGPRAQAEQRTAEGGCGPSLSQARRRHRAHR